MFGFESERKALKAKIKRLQTEPRSPEVSQELRATSELLWECESIILIGKATRWGIEVPLAGDKPDWYVQTNANQYLTESAKAILNRRIRKTRFASYKGYAEIITTILSLIVAILALFLKS